MLTWLHLAIPNSPLGALCVICVPLLRHPCRHPGFESLQNQTLTHCAGSNKNNNSSSTICPQLGDRTIDIILPKFIILVSYDIQIRISRTQNRPARVTLRVLFTLRVCSRVNNSSYYLRAVAKEYSQKIWWCPRTHRMPWRACRRGTRRTLMRLKSCIEESILHAPATRSSMPWPLRAGRVAWRDARCH
jgi:hypothetical protein